MRYYDRKNKRLIYIAQQATPSFWDNQWRSIHSFREMLNATKTSYAVDITKKYIKPQDGIILEGGCGRAQHVAALTHNAYRCIGIDSASQTVQALQSAAPELDVRLGDVFQLDFTDAYFSGYWSIGVIEHFWDGYEPIGREMLRVIKPGGYLFLIFPYMSILRRIKARLGLYPQWKGNEQLPSSFYQFALNRADVAQNFIDWGFELTATQSLCGLKGFTDEVTLLKPVLNNLADYKGKAFLIRAFRYVLFSTLSMLSGGHSILLILKRRHNAA